MKYMLVPGVKGKWNRVVLYSIANMYSLRDLGLTFSNIMLLAEMQKDAF